MRISFALLFVFCGSMHAIRAAASYLVDGQALHYVTLQHEEKLAPLGSIDRALTLQLNASAVWRSSFRKLRVASGASRRLRRHLTSTEEQTFEIASAQPANRSNAPSEDRRGKRSFHGANPLHLDWKT
jgi:hypothetical protein